MRKSFLLFATALLAIVPAFTQSKKPENKGWVDLLPPGEGRDTVVNSCGSCHGVKDVVNGRKDQTGWQKAVNDMIQRGAPVFPEEIAPLTAYLAKNFPLTLPRPVNVNTATVDDLKKIPGMNPELAGKLVEARAKAGPFKDAADLQRAANLDKAQFDAVRYLLKYSE